MAANWDLRESESAEIGTVGLWRNRRRRKIDRMMMMMKKKKMMMKKMMMMMMMMMMMISCQRTQAEVPKSSED